MSEHPLPPAPPPAPAAAAAPVDLQHFLQIFSAVMLPMFLASLDQTLLAAASPAIAAEFGGLADTPWIALGYLIASASTIPLYGRLGDRRGYRPMLLAALALFGVGTTLGGFAGGMGTLVAARVLQGLGGGGLMVLSQALIGELVPPRERPRFQGWFAAVFTLSSVAGPVIGGWVVHGPGWRWLFWGLLPGVAFALWRVSRLPRRAAAPAAPDAPPFDGVGLAGFVLATSGTLVWLTFAGHRFAWGSPTGLALAGAALAGWLLLIGHQRRRARRGAAFLPLDVLALPGLAAVAGTIVVFAGAMFALVFFMPVYVQLGHGADAARAGLALLPLTLGMAAGATLTGRVVARTGVAGRLPPYGLALAAAGAAMLALLPSTPGLRALAMGLCGLGFGTVMPNAQILVQTVAGRERLGAASALVSLARALGATFGTAVFGALAFEALAGEAVAQPTGAAAVALTRAFHLGFGVLAGVLLLGALLATRMPRLALGPRGEAAAAAVGPAGAD
ncbi:MFS transporter [Piscinibacter sakaiensis]|nr:MFS transporter [Piscinibacter sakaiensis]